MAFVAPVVPLIAAMGGAGATAAAGISAGALLGGLTLATGVYSALETRKQGQIMNQEAKRAAVREADAARGEEIERRRALMDTLATRSAVAGAANVTTDGSIGALTRRDIRDNRNDLLTTSINSKAKQRALRTQGRNAERQGNAAAVSSLLDTGVGLYKAAG